MKKVKELNNSKFFFNPYDYFRNHPKSPLRFLIILIGWSFQGFFYADRTEKFFKVFIEFILLCLFLPLFYLLTNNLLFSLIVSFLISHTCNWLFNTGFWCSFRGKYGIKIPGIVLSNDPKYIKELIKRLELDDSIDSAAIFGSFSRNEIKGIFDIDLRILRKPGVIFGFKACLFGLRERTIALVNKIPLDMFIIDNTDHLKNLNPNEIPVIIYDHSNLLKNYYNQIQN